MRTYDDWKTTDPRDMEPPEKPERDPDDAYDEWCDEQMQKEPTHMRTASEHAYDAGKYEAEANILRGKLVDRERALEAVFETLREVDEYLDDRVDINWEGTGPNKEMSLQTEVRAAIRKAEGR